MIKLPTPQVLFNSEEHSYTHAITGDTLVGITSTLLKHIKPDKYKDIPAATLAKAAERGHAVHTEVELYHTLDITPTSPEATAWVKIYNEEGLNFLASEYLITDGVQFASAIDIVFQASENSVHLADVKTTATFDKDLVSWQLSIYAYLFGVQCPEVSVDKLYGIHLRGDKAKLIELPMKSKEEVEKLIIAYNSDLPYEEEAGEVPTDIAKIIDTLTTAQGEVNEWQAVVDKCREQLSEYMQTSKIKTLDTDSVKITQIAESTRTSFDSKKFKEEHADLYNSYIKKTTTKPTLKITLK